MKAKKVSQKEIDAICSEVTQRIGCQVIELMQRDSGDIARRLSKLEAAQPAPEPPQTLADKFNGPEFFPWHREFRQVKCWARHTDGEVGMATLLVFRDGSMRITSFIKWLIRGLEHTTIVNRDGTGTRWIKSWHLNKQS